METTDHKDGGATADQWEKRSQAQGGEKPLTSSEKWIAGAGWGKTAEGARAQSPKSNSGTVGGPFYW